MTLISELLDALVGPHPSELRAEKRIRELQVQANIGINSGERDWYPRFIEALAEEIDLDATQIRLRAPRIIARSEAIRYIQLVNPEMIRIADQNIETALGIPSEPVEFVPQQ